MSYLITFLLGMTAMWAVSHMTQTVAAIKDGVQHIKDIRDHFKSQSTNK